MREGRGLVRESSDGCCNVLCERPFSDERLGGDSVDLVARNKVRNSWTYGFHHSRKVDAGDEREAMLHIVLDVAAGEDRVHDVHACGVNSHQDLALAGLGDGNVVNRSCRSKAVDGKRSHAQSTTSELVDHATIPHRPLWRKRAGNQRLGSITERTFLLGSMNHAAQEWPMSAMPSVVTGSGSE